MSRKTLESPVTGADAAPIPDLEGEVLRRYRDGARRAEPGLCCPQTLDAAPSDWLPREIVEKDYGCGDPTVYVAEGETVLDLGSGAGKACYVLARKVGPAGRVIGVDFNDEMLALARKYEDPISERIGFRNVRFVKGKIQDLALDLALAEEWLRQHPVRNLEQLRAFEAECDRLRRERPLVPDSSVDVVISNCVLNLVRPEDKAHLFGEIFRVLRRGGRAVISDIVCDEDPTPSILSDPVLWSGCIAGAFREDRFLALFEQAGFYGVEILARQVEPWQVIEGIEFRSMTLRAWKGKDGPCLERNQAIIYRGPWSMVRDDDGHTLHRGQRIAVCDKTFGILTHPRGPYHRDVLPVPPREEIPLEQAKPFSCAATRARHPRETKGQDYDLTKTADSPASCCGPDGCT
ncbi:MAG: methyltransferase domain-containing protein [Planctomycetes bacterium]|nr:methyltransferase domain-containing protein [Planctomycetota bacterium]